MRPAPSPNESGSILPGTSRERILHSAKTLFSSNGYENTSTAAIARMAGSSESQLIKHFGGKEGVLEAIFDEGWARMREGLGALGNTAGREKLQAMMNLILSSLQEDAELKELMLLEGRRVRKEGHLVMLTQGFLDFVRGVDAVLEQMQSSGQLRREISPDVARSALMGMIEGLLRDQMLAQRMNQRSGYSDAQLRQVFDLVMGSFLSHP